MVIFSPLVIATTLHDKRCSGETAEETKEAKQLHPVHSHLTYAPLILKKSHMYSEKIQTIGTPTKA